MRVVPKTDDAEISTRIRNVYDPTQNVSSFSLKWPQCKGGWDMISCGPQEGDGLQFNYGAKVKCEIESGDSKESSTIDALVQPLRACGSDLWPGVSASTSAGYKNYSRQETPPKNLYDYMSIDVHAITEAKQKLMNKLNKGSWKECVQCGDAAVNTSTAIEPRYNPAVKEDLGNGDEESALKTFLQSARMELTSNHSFHSAVTLDTADYEDIDKIERLGSWSTQGSGGTIQTFTTLNTTEGQLDERLILNMLHINNNDTKMQNHTYPKKENRKEGNMGECGHRARKVKFAYPPISRLREQPRFTQEEKEALFFTEDELKTLEDDRTSTEVADDVECVVITERNEGQTQQSNNVKRVYSKKLFYERGRQGKRNQRRSRWKITPAPDLHERSHYKGRWGSFSPSQNETVGDDNNNMVQGVGIYLRQRSLGEKGRRDYHGEI